MPFIHAGIYYSLNVYVGIEWETELKPIVITYYFPTEYFSDRYCW